MGISPYTTNLVFGLLVVQKPGIVRGKDVVAMIGLRRMALSEVRAPPSKKGIGREVTLPRFQLHLSALLHDTRQNPTQRFKHLRDRIMYDASIIFSGSVQILCPVLQKAGDLQCPCTQNVPSLATYDLTLSEF